MKLNTTTRHLLINIITTLYHRRLAQDEWKENLHPRAKNGQFGSGGAAASKSEEYKDKRGFVRSGGLSPEHRRHESIFYNAIEKNTPKLVEKYLKTHGKITTKLYKTLIEGLH